MSGILHIPLEKAEIVSALELALSQNFIDNLRNRHPLVALDSKLRGYIGELAFQKWAKTNGIEFQDSNVKDSISGMDIDFIYIHNGKRINIELKTSLIPDVDQDLQEMMHRRDIKLIRRNNATIEELAGDVHVQLIFKQLRLRKDDWLKKQAVNLDEPVEEIYHKIAAYRYQSDCFLAGWVDKTTLIEQVNQKAKHLKVWKYGKRAFWICNLEREAKTPHQLINYLS